MSYWETNRGIGTVERVIDVIRDLPSRRDVFAAHALSGLIVAVHRNPAVAAALDGEDDRPLAMNVAAAAFDYADAMMKVRSS